DERGLTLGFAARPCDLVLLAGGLLLAGLPPQVLRLAAVGGGALLRRAQLQTHIHLHGLRLGEFLGRAVTLRGGGFLLLLRLLHAREAIPQLGELLISLPRPLLGLVALDGGALDAAARRFLRVLRRLEAVLGRLDACPWFLDGGLRAARCGATLRGGFQCGVEASFQVGELFLLFGDVRGGLVNLRSKLHRWGSSPAAGREPTGAEE